MKTSLFGYKWIDNSNDLDSRILQDIVDRSNIPTELAGLLLTRGISSQKDVELFLHPKLKDLMPEPKSLLDVDIAVKRIICAINAKEKIVVFADYDVDGASSAAILKRFFRSIGVEIEIYVPDRILEGYGPNVKALLDLGALGFTLAITVDCGTVAFEPLSAAKEAGLDVIVVDHHKGVHKKPESIAVINPNRLDDLSDLGFLCGAGVVFMLITAINRELRNSEWYKNNNITEPNIMELTSLVALATICDIMPLKNLNRAFIRRGLEFINSGCNCGIAEILKIACNGTIPTDIDEYHLGFMIGPRINAGGRVGKSDLGARLLSTNNQSEAQEIANTLNNLNAERKTIEEGIVVDAIHQVEAWQHNKLNVIFVGSDSFHQGVIGIVASKLKDKYNKPSIVMEFKTNADGIKIAKASCRSVDGVDIGLIINKAVAEGLLLMGGGHAMAGGFSVEHSKLQEVETFFNINIPNELPTLKKLNISGIITAAGINLRLLEFVQQMKPFGPENYKPVFVINKLKIINMTFLKEKHLALILQCELSKSSIRTVIFNIHNRITSDIADFLSLKGKTVDIAFTIKPNNYMGQTKPEVELMDILYSNNDR